MIGIEHAPAVIGRPPAASVDHCRSYGCGSSWRVCAKKVHAPLLSARVKAAPSKPRPQIFLLLPEVTPPEAPSFAACLAWKPRTWLINEAQAKPGQVTYRQAPSQLLLAVQGAGPVSCQGGVWGKTGVYGEVWGGLGLPKSVDLRWVRGGRARQTRTCPAVIYACGCRGFGPFQYMTNQPWQCSRRQSGNMAAWQLLIESRRCPRHQQETCSPGYVKTDAEESVWHPIHGIGGSLLVRPRIGHQNRPRRSRSLLL
jgi:hypothetical protein